MITTTDRQIIIRKYRYLQMITLTNNTVCGATIDPVRPIIDDNPNNESLNSVGYISAE